MNLSTHKLAEQARKIAELNGHLTFRISRMSKLLEVEAAARLAGSGFSLTGYRMMMIIGIFDEITVSDLSRIMVIDRAQISRAASELIERGMLAARADRASRRKKLLRLTAEGQAAFAALEARFAGRQAALEALLGRAELAGLWAGIEKISDFASGGIDGG